ncbi:MAG: response regulator transcription factor [Cyclobacteriaceae bacterium]|nr:response regulator transcription factor [Cyclobacteriaceae bacterium]
MIRIVVADDHKIVREALMSLLEDVPGFKVVGDACDGEGLLKLLKTIAADIAVVDVVMPGMDGISVTRHIKSNYPATKVLVLSMSIGDGFISNAIDAGADGYILKHLGKDELVLAIDTIMDGESYYTRELLPLVRSFKILQEESEMPFLSEKEKKVLSLLSDGYGSKQIANDLDTSVHTVNCYRKNLLYKLHAKNVPELIKIAIREGYILSFSLMISVMSCEFGLTIFL